MSFKLQITLIIIVLLYITSPEHTGNMIANLLRFLWQFEFLRFFITAFFLIIAVAIGLLFIKKPEERNPPRR